MPNFGRSYPQIDIEEPFLEKAWQLCGQEGKPATEFRDAIAQALHGYHWRRTSFKRMSFKDRKRFYAKVEKHATILRDLLLELDHVSYPPKFGH
ncbi:hypothetical protein [uncultured Aliiroseovarius sp.]|uniref:hypothetical protein n=1 Tax=uncultured Aliiroseovarius sp. TaxID=1658783 RepID=UPI002599156A|nr:hypothetical protein [uncultured Aliiroseovarius sp.]